mgnify:CR=1 FL=1
MDPRVKKARSMRTFPMINADGTPSTVKFATVSFDGRNYVVPTIFPPDKQSSNPKDWTIYEKGQEREAFDMAKSRGEVFDFGPDSLGADRFARGSWKQNIKKQIRIN